MRKNETKAKISKDKVLIWVTIIGVILLVSITFGWGIYQKFYR